MRDQEIIGLWEAYQQVHSQPQEEVEQLDEEPKGLPYGPVGKGFKRLPAGPKRERMMKNAQKYTRAAMADADREGEAVGDNRNKMGRINSALTNPRLREGVDLFDYILEHLVAEGYADTNQAALAIMANMSEEWKQSILSEDPVQDFRDMKRAKENAAGLRGPELSHGYKGTPKPGSATAKTSSGDPITDYRSRTGPFSNVPKASATPKTSSVTQPRSREFTNPPS